MDFMTVDRTYIITILEMYHIHAEIGPYFACFGWYVTRQPMYLYKNNGVYAEIVQGDADSFDFRVFHYSKDTLVSSWHDVPLYAGDGLLNFLCEIPKETSAKMELATDETRTPIKQDTKKGKLRFYPYNINWNYGMLPQTWEDPGHVDATLQAGVSCDATLQCDLFLSCVPMPVQ